MSELSHDGEEFFSTIDLRYAFSQLPLDKATEKQCNLYSRRSGHGNVRTYNRLCGLTEMPAEFQKALSNTIKGLMGSYSFLVDLILVGGLIKTNNEKFFKKSL